VGGTLSIDADQNPATGGADTPGFECCIVFIVSQLAPMAELQFFSDGIKGRSVPISADVQDITRSRYLNPCLVTQGRDAYLLIPTAVFGPPAPQRMNLVHSTHEMGFQKPPAKPKIPGIRVKAPVRQNRATIDRLPDPGAADHRKCKEN
jgi:hypothetical protein